MGVDAEMFARIKGRENWIAEGDVRGLSYKLASTIGHDWFLITEGTDWAGSPHHHALSIIKPYGGESYEDDADLIGKVIWSQDGEPIIAGEDEQFVRAHLMSRYYGPDYARGNWPVLRMTALWMRQNLGGEVWYGGDSGGICAEPLTEARLADLDRFFLANGRRPYSRYESPVFGNREHKPTCRVCDVEMIDTGGGRGQVFWICDGCGARVITVGTVERKLKRGQDFFEASRELESSAG